MDRLRTIIIPTWPQAAACFGLSLLMILATHFDAISRRFFSTGAGPLIEQSYTDQLTMLSQIELVRTGVIVGFWAIVGLVAYTIYLTASNLVVEARNEVVIETEYANKGGGGGRWRGVFQQLVSGLFLIASLVVSGLWAVPAWFYLAERILFVDLTVLAVAGFVLGVVGLAANIYLLWSLWQIVRISDQL